jgi:hypothetical protein
MQVSFTVNKFQGYAGATEFTFNSTPVPAVNETVQSILWDFGDGTYSQVEDPAHIYYYPGIYKVTCNVYGKTTTGTSTLAQYTSSLRVNLYVNESIYFDYVPPPTFASHYNRYPFRVHITSPYLGDHYVDLGAQYSRSYQHQDPQNKWSFLRPEWKFLDLNGNIIQSVKTTDTPIKVNKEGQIDPNGAVVGVSGYAEFYFIDDIFNFDLAVNQQPYTTILATLQTSATRGFNDGFNTDKDLPGFANSLAEAICPYISLWRPPQYLRITENGLREYANPRWVGAKNPIIIYSAYKGSDYPDEWIDGNGVKLYNPESNFSHNFPLTNDKAVNLSVTLTGVSSFFVPSSTVILWTDGTGYKVPGYYKGHFETSNPSSSQFAIITAGCFIPTPDISANYINPVLWLSNPEAGMVATVQYQFQTSLSDISTRNLNLAQVHAFDAPIILEPDFSKDPMSLSGFHGINSIAALPAPHFHAWASDGEMNMLYRFATTGHILCAVDINNIVRENGLGFASQNQVSPASIALDGNRNIWMTLYDTVSVLKFDPAGNFLFAAHPLNTIGYALPSGANMLPSMEEFSRFDQESYFYDATEEDVNLIEPTCIETDIYDNVWVTYSNTYSGFLIKYNTNGVLQFYYNYPIQYHPQDIISDRDGNVWVAVSHISYGDRGTIEKRDTTGNVISSFGPFRSPNNITLDVSQNLWFTQSYNWIGRINNRNSTVRSLQLSGNRWDINSNIPDWIYPADNTDETAFEGIASDIRNKIYVLNSVENQMYVVNANTFAFENRFYINPQGFTYFLNDQYESTQVGYNVWSKSLQAQGDWSGWRWVNKYGPTKLPQYTLTNTSTFYLTGESNWLTFNTSNPYDIFKVNEDHDLPDQMYKMAFMPSLIDSPFLFNTFLGSIFGKYPFEHDDLGVESYEKIANFVENQTDLDYCNIDQLYSLAEQVDLDTDDFILKYPPAIKRLMDLASVNQSRLWGGRLLNQNNFAVPSDKGVLNRGEPLTTATYFVSAGTPVILKTKSLNSYKYIPTGLIYGLSGYSLNMLATSIGLDPITWDQYYEFYSFIPGSDNTQIEGIIDWDNPQTTLNETLSSEHEWLGEEKVLETMFSYYLYKGLGLLE